MTFHCYSSSFIRLATQSTHHSSFIGRRCCLCGRGEDELIIDVMQLCTACGYPERTVNKVKQQRSKPKSKPPTRKKPDSDKPKGLVVVPYVLGLSERVTRVFKKHGFSTALKPHRTLRNLLVHPKDKLDTKQKAEAIYEITCADCHKAYIGETGRPFGVRLLEHQTEVQKLESMPYTRSTRKTSVTEQHKSAITDHVDFS